MQSVQFIGVLRCMAILFLLFGGTDISQAYSCFFAEVLLVLTKYTLTVRAREVCFNSKCCVIDLISTSMHIWHKLLGTLGWTRATPGQASNLVKSTCTALHHRERHNVHGIVEWIDSMQ